MRYLIPLSIYIILTGCEPNRWQEVTENGRLIKEYTLQLDSLQSALGLLGSGSNNLSPNTKLELVIMKSELDNLKRLSQKSTSALSIRQFKIPLTADVKKINVMNEIGKTTGQFKVQLISVENIQYTSSQKQPVYQLTITSESIDTFGIPHKGLVSYYMYSRPEQGIQNSVSSELMVNDQNPNIFLEGNDQYQISGSLILWITGPF